MENFFEEYKIRYEIGEKIKESFGGSIAVLFIFIIFSIFKLIFSNSFTEYIIVLIFSIASLINFALLLNHSGDKVKNKNYRKSKILLNLIYLLSVPLYLYVFFVKGIYGIFQLFHEFGWWSLIIASFALLLSFNLMKQIMKLETD